MPTPFFLLQIQPTLSHSYTPSSPPLHQQHLQSLHCSLLEQLLCKVRMTTHSVVNTQPLGNPGRGQHGRRSSSQLWPGRRVTIVCDKTLQILMVHGWVFLHQPAVGSDGWFVQLPVQDKVNMAVRVKYVSQWKLVSCKGRRNERNCSFYFVQLFYSVIIYFRLQPLLFTFYPFLLSLTTYINNSRLDLLNPGWPATLTTPLHGLLLNNFFYQLFSHHY